MQRYQHKIANQMIQRNLKAWAALEGFPSIGEFIDAAILEKVNKDKLQYAEPEAKEETR